MAKTKVKATGLSARVEAALATGPRLRTAPRASALLTTMLARVVGPERASASGPKAGRKRKASSGRQATR